MPEKIRAYLIEDEYMVSKAVRRQLENLDLQVVGTANDAAAGLDGVKQLKPDLLLLDIGLPDTNGIEICRQLMAECPLPIIMITAYDDEQQLRAALEAGASCYVLKPTTEDRLKAAIEQALAPSDTAENTPVQ